MVTLQEQLTETKRLAELAKQQAASDIAAGSAQTFQAGTATPITSSVIAPTATPNFQTPQPSTTSSIQGITTDIPKIEPDPIEKQGDELTQRLIAINESLAGRGAFRRQKETELGATEAQQSLDDLSARLRDLERREKAIPIQIQKEFEGRGVTEGGVAPIQAGKLRENAIEALTVSSLIDAASNRFTSAQRKVARAVEEKYGPLLEEQEIKLANLELILKSPAYDRATKERAEKQKLIEETRKTQLEAKKKEQEEIWKTATDAAKGGASSTILESIRTAKTKEEALALAAPFLAREEKPTPGDIGEFENAKAKGLIPQSMNFFEYIQKKGAAGRKGKGDTTFTDTQTNAGAATAGIPIKDFEKLDVDTQNFFINNPEQIKAKKKMIDEAKKNDTDPAEVEKEISESNAPEAVKDSLIKYLKEVFPKEEKSKPFWKRIFGL